MQISYQFQASAEYFRAVIDRQYRQGPWLLRLPVQFGIIGALAATCAALIAPTSLAGKAVLFFVIVGLVVIPSVWATKRGLMKKFRNRAGFGSEVTVTLSDAGIALGGDHSQATSAWSSYPTAIRFPDGILLKRPGSIRWLPDSAIMAGSAAEATELVAARTSLRRVN